MTTVKTDTCKSAGTSHMWSVNVVNRGMLRALLLCGVFIRLPVCYREAKGGFDSPPSALTYSDSLGAQSGSWERLLSTFLHQREREHSCFSD